MNEHHIEELRKTKEFHSEEMSKHREYVSKIEHQWSINKIG